MREYGLTHRQAISHAQSARAKAELYVNDVYMIQVFRNGDQSCRRLAIRRLDHGVIKRDWREFQAIKNQIVGPEIEACELYPAESRKVDATNVYHLWCLPAGQQFPFGYTEGDVREYDREATSLNL